MALGSIDALRPLANHIFAAVCVTGQFRGVCSDEHLWFFVNRILPAFGEKADLFVVVPSGPDCTVATTLFPNATDLRCVNDTPFSLRERRWLEKGPNLCWNRERYILQLRLISRCGKIIKQQMRSGAAYKWVMRARADVLWQRFPWQHAPHLAEKEAWHSALQMSWSQMLQWQALSDTFALGRPELMLPYMALYDFVLNPMMWEQYDRPQGVSVWRRIWGHRCNYPELVLENYLFSRSIPVRYSRHFCFVKMRTCGRALENHCGPRVPALVDEDGAVVDDLAAFRQRVLEGNELFAEQTFPPHYEHDSLLAAKLVEFFYREQSRMGRPPKIVDLGCGRGTLVKELQAWGLLVVGVDKNPILTGTLEDVGVVMDATSNLSFTIHSNTPRCDFRVVPFRHFDGMNFENAKYTGNFAATGGDRPSNEADNIKWINYLMGRCCKQSVCVAFDSDGLLKYGMRPEVSWKATSKVWTYVKINKHKKYLDALVEVPNQFGFGALHIGGDGKMDWVISLDMGEGLAPGPRRSGFFGTIQKLAGEGVILSWGRFAGTVDEEELTEAMLLFGFYRDMHLEEELRLFASVGCCKHFRHTLLAFRRSNVAPSAPCALPPKTLPLAECQRGVSFGCVRNSIWVRGLCGGLFERRGIVIECFAVSGHPYEYEECSFPPIAYESSVFASNATGDSLATMPVGKGDRGLFEILHGSIPDMFASADPLSRPGELVWQLGPPALLVVTFKFVRLLAEQPDGFEVALRHAWVPEMKYLLSSWVSTVGPTASWVPEILAHLTRRARHILKVSSLHSGVLLTKRRRDTSLLSVASRLLGGVGRFARVFSCHAFSTVSRVHRLIRMTWRRHYSKPLMQVLLEGAKLWPLMTQSALACVGAVPLPLRVRASADGSMHLLPIAVGHKGYGGPADIASRYFHRLLALPMD